MKKRILWVVTALLAAGLAAAALLYFLPVCFGGRSPAPMEALPGDTLLTAEQAKADRDYLISYVESVHPFFIDGSDQTAYQLAAAEYRAATENSMTVDAMMAATAKYLTVLGDGHTKLNWQFGDEVAIFHGWRAGKMMYADENGLTDRWITAVDDVPTEHILHTIDSFFPAENEMAVQINYNYYFTSSNLLLAAGVDVKKDVFTLTLNDGAKIECGWYVAPLEPVPAASPEENHWYMDGDVFVVRFVSCTDDENLKGIARELKKTVKNGCGKVIIDARGNGGGSSNACERLLEAMGMKAPSYGMLVRYSPAAREQRGYLRSAGQCLMQPSMKAQQNERVQLAVLCDRYTYSSAAMLLVFVQDGKLGTVIGEVSSNMPNHYGDITFVSLENTHLYASVSHKRFLRPSGETESRRIVPDVETASSEAYQAAMEFLNGR